ncbi:MAG: methyltransferase [Gammaproteobacteria bacterium]|nr:methyltransferase [Gammaproteobacteria bacterium]
MRPSFVAILTMGLILTAATSPAAEGVDPALSAVIAGDHRSEANKARDQFRHPAETLTFFGLKANMTVVEVWPSTGWYSEILGPYLVKQGKYYAAGWDPESKIEFIQRGIKVFSDKLAARPDLYAGTEMTVLSFPDQMAIAPAGTADMVLTFRNIHNWMGGNNAEKAFAAMYAALKPGGVLGVVEHRARTDVPQDPKAASGYVREDHAIELAKKAGFVLEASSEINANPRDTRDYAKGVWTLPPTYREGEKDRGKYTAIGESDRFTLRFRKPL